MGYEWARRAALTAGDANFVQTASTTGTTLLNRGVSICTRKSSVGGSTQTYTLQAPTRTGLEKLILVTNATSSRSVRVTAASGSGFLSTNANPSTGITKVTFKLREWGVYLIATSTKAWLVSTLSTRPPALS